MKWAVLLGMAASALASERWRIQYFYDEDRSSLTINDLKFPSPWRGVAVGFIQEKEKTKPAVLVTGDGGVHWTLLPAKEIGLSLFFLDESLGWMVTSAGVWQTQESGRSWQKIKAPPSLQRVCFVDRLHGWAVGMRKAVFETVDGGRRWRPVAAAAQPKANPEFTQYGWVEFVNQQVGIITGWNQPPRRSDHNLPDWMEPDKAEQHREWPRLSIVLETRDGGKTWRPETTSMFGRITRVRLSPNGEGLGLIEFSGSFAWPSEVFLLDWKTGKSTRVYREKTRTITDVALLPSGRAYLVGVETFGALHRTPVPGKVRILKSDDRSAWREMDVDYRASARRATLAAADTGDIWVATDTGMILKLVSE